MRTEICPKGRKHLGGGEAPVYEKYQIHSPNGAAEEESYMPKTVSVSKTMEIIINSFTPSGLNLCCSFSQGASPPAIC